MRRNLLKDLALSPLIYIRLAGVVSHSTSLIPGKVVVPRPNSREGGVGLGMTLSTTTVKYSGAYMHSERQTEPIILPLLHVHGVITPTLCVHICMYGLTNWSITLSALAHNKLEHSLTGPHPSLVKGVALQD